MLCIIQSVTNCILTNLLRVWECMSTPAIPAGSSQGYYTFTSSEVGPSAKIFVSKDNIQLSEALDQSLPNFSTVFSFPYMHEHGCVDIAQLKNFMYFFLKKFPK